MEKKTKSVCQERQEKLHKILFKATNDFFCDIGGYYYKAIDKMQKEIKEAVFKNM